MTAAERIEHDFYPTPPWCVRALLSVPEARARLSGQRWFIEPAAGDGALVRALDAELPGMRSWVTVDVRVDAQADHCRDFLAMPAGYLGRFDVAFTNPPWSDAFRYVEACVSTARLSALLLPLGFLQSAGRGAWLAEHPPDVYVLSRRPIFRRDVRRPDANGKAAWMLWETAPDNFAIGPRHGVCRIIPPDACK